MSEQEQKTEHDLDVMSIDMNDFTIEDIEFVEDSLGIGIAAIGTLLKDPEAKQARALRALAAIGHRRNNPDLTFEQAFQQAGKLKLTMASKPVPPTDDNGSAPSSPLSSTTASL